MSGWQYIVISAFFFLGGVMAYPAAMRIDHPLAYFSAGIVAAHLIGESRAVRVAWRQRRAEP